MVESRKILDTVTSEADNKFVLQVIQWHLTPLGVWPLNFGLITICTFLLLFILIPGIVCFTKESDPVMKLKIIGPTSFCFLAVIKYNVLIIGRHNIATCFEHILFDWQRDDSVSDRNIMINYAQLGRRGAIICAAFVFSGGIFFAWILPHLSTSGEKDEKNITIRPIAYPIYFTFFNPQDTPFYEIIFSMQCCCAILLHSITSAGCSLIIIFTMHTIGQLEILIFWLKNFIDGNEGSMAKTLPDIIRHHVRILRFVSNIDDALGGINFFEITGSTLGFCIASYDLLLEWKERNTVGVMTYVMLVNAFICNLFLFCYISECLRESCRRVGETTYMMEWHKLPRIQVLGLTMIIVTSHKPATLTAGKLLDLSLNGFCTIVRTSLAYLNFLRQLLE